MKCTKCCEMFSPKEERGEQLTRKELRDDKLNQEKGVCSDCFWDSIAQIELDGEAWENHVHRHGEPTW